MRAFFILCGTGVFTLLAEVFNLRKWVIAISLVGLATAFGSTILEWKDITYAYHGMLVLDRVSKSFIALLLVSSFIWFWIFSEYFKEESHRADRASLLLFSIFGAGLMVSFNNMAVLFLGIEILSISLYVLAGSLKGSMFSNEASFKYFLMGSFATGFLLFGMALVYGATGSFNISEIVTTLQNNSAAPIFFKAGVLLMMVGLAFKISAVPFHFWAPDVYQGSPTAITSFMSTIVKVAAFSAFAKIFTVCFGKLHSTLVPYEQAILILTLVVANCTAVFQSSVKRMLAYSSVGHVGYLLLALSSSNSSQQVIYYYLAAYVAGSLLAFAVLHLLEKRNIGSNLENFRGLSNRSPLLAFSMSVALLSLAGIPPLAGFFAKYQVFNLALVNGHPKLVLLAVVTSLVGVYFYFRPIIAMYRAKSEEKLIDLSLNEKVPLIILAGLSILFAILPEIIRF
jgi:NADH-quinone oxidoreductase subunit N